MQTTGTPPTRPFNLDTIPALRGVAGMRAVVDFAPKHTSTERLIAGVVTRLDTGEVSFTCAIDQRKMEHAFGPDGATFYTIANKLCESLAQHWQAHEDAQSWKPPFTGATLADLRRFSGRTATESQRTMLERTSALHTLLNAYEITAQKRMTGIVEKVRSAVSKDTNSKHLTKRFNRELALGDSAGPMRVDFLGQHYACYFLQITRSARGLDVNTDRAFGKLYELQALQRFVKKPKKSLGLLEDERPTQFELVMVGDRNDAIQRRAIYQVEALADKRSTVVKTLKSANEAAGHVSDRERLAA